MKETLRPIFEDTEQIIIVAFCEFLIEIEIEIIFTFSCLFMFLFTTLEHDAVQLPLRLLGAFHVL